MNMTVEKVVAGSIMVGDELQINYWENRFTVCAVSDGFILANHDVEYTIVQRKPTDFGPYNGIPEGSIVCGADWWIFGWAPEEPFEGDDFTRYEFDNPEWCKHYMADLESGRTEVSMRRREMVHSLSVYRKGVLVMNTED